HHILHLHSFPTRRSSDLVERSLSSVHFPAEDRGAEGKGGVRLANDLFGQEERLRGRCPWIEIYRRKFQMQVAAPRRRIGIIGHRDRKSTRLNSSHVSISY